MIKIANRLLEEAGLNEIVFGDFFGYWFTYS